jgi:hypothetical protein
MSFSNLGDIINLVLKVGEEALFPTVKANTTPCREAKSGHCCPFSNIHSDFITPSVQTASPFLLIDSLILEKLTWNFIKFDSAPNGSAERFFYKESVFRLVYKLLQHIPFDSKSERIKLLCSPLNCVQHVSMLSNFSTGANHWAVGIFSLESFQMNFAEGLQYSLDSAQIYSIPLSVLGTHIVKCYEAGLNIMDIDFLCEARDTNSIFSEWDNKEIHRLPFPQQQV